MSAIIQFVAVFVASQVVKGIELPQSDLEKLGSEQFRLREESQARLLEWGRGHLPGAKLRFYLVSKNHVDPEVRGRCMTILRELIMEEYMHEGSGFIGIEMRSELVAIPKQERQLHSIRIMSVKKGSPGEIAGLVLGDIIFSLDGVSWPEVDAMPAFRDKIASKKPQSTVTLQVVRNAQVLVIPVKLGRRPIIQSVFSFNGDHSANEAAERTAQEEYFRNKLKELAPVR